MTRDLVLHLKAEYFDQIKAGEKPHEYRLRSPYWKKRLVGREYDRVVFCKGYPSRDDHENRIVRPWRGYIELFITHPHFGPDRVPVYAIRT